jgi:hypothetical protein
MGENKYMTHTMGSMVINDVGVCRARRRWETVFPVDSGHGGAVEEQVLLDGSGVNLLGYINNLTSPSFPTHGHSAQHRPGLSGT